MIDFQEDMDPYAALNIGSSIKPMGELPSHESGLSNEEFIKSKIEEIQKFYTHLIKSRINVLGKEAYNVNSNFPGHMGNIRSYVQDIQNKLDDMQSVMGIYTYHDERLDDEDDDGLKYASGASFNDALAAL